MKQKFLIFASILAAAGLLQAQTGRIQGHVTDSQKNSPLRAANVMVKGTFTGTTTDSDGFFKLDKLPAGPVILKISYMGYQPISLEVQVDEAKTVKQNIKLKPSILSMGEVVVTSSRYEKQIKDVAMPMGIVDQKTIEFKAPADVSTAVNQVAGVAMGRDGAWGSQVNIRGLGKQNIVMLVDGNRIETATNIAASLSLVDINDIDRIEVVKGAASSLYGSGAMGGVVNIHTTGGQYQNQFTAGGSMTGGYSAVNNGSNGSLSLNAGASNWFVKLRGTARNAENTETPEGTLKNSQFTDNNISAQAGLKPWENHEFRVDYQRFYAEDVGIPGGAPFPTTATTRYPEEKREMMSVKYNIKKLLPSMAGLSIKYSRQLIERRVELIPNANAIVHPNGDHQTNSLQLQSNWILGKKNYLIAGIDAWQRDLTTWRIKEVIPKNQIIGECPIPDSDYRSIGLYVQDEIKLMQDKLKLTLGGRIDQIKVTNEKALNPEYIIVAGVRNDAPPTQTVLWEADEADDISYSASFGALYTLLPDVDMSFNASRAFRSPSLEERYQFIQLGAATYWGDADLEPETATFFDIGLRIWKPAFSISGNAFINLIDNKVIDEFQDETLYIKTNVGEARLYGADLNADYNVLNRFVIYGSAAYVRGEDTGSNVDLPEIPPLSGRLGLRVPVFNAASIDLSANMAADQEHVAAGEQTTAGYTCFDLYLQSRPVQTGFLNHSFVLGVENITDKAYRHHLSTYRGLIRMEPGRNVLVRWKVDF